MDKKSLEEYLDNQGIHDEIFRDYILKYEYPGEGYKLCSVGKFDFMISHFFDDSHLPGYGLIATNAILEGKDEDLVAIGLIEGDDIICYRKSTEQVLLWMVQTGVGELVEVADTFKQFIEKCTYQ